MGNTYDMIHISDWITPMTMVVNKDLWRASPSSHRNSHYLDRHPPVWMEWSERHIEEVYDGHGCGVRMPRARAFWSLICPVTGSPATAIGEKRLNHPDCIPSSGASTQIDYVLFMKINHLQVNGALRNYYCCGYRLATLITILQLPGWHISIDNWLKRYSFIG